MKNKRPNICVMVCTYNGARYLREQINSVISQKSVDITIVAHDDGSVDNTIEILKDLG